MPARLLLLCLTLCMLLLRPVLGIQLCWWEHTRTEHNANRPERAARAEHSAEARDGSSMYTHKWGALARFLC